MVETLEELEQRRSSLYQQMQALGDFRPGTISVNFRKCGKRGCACAQPKHSGQMKRVFSELSAEELHTLEVALKKVGKRAAALMEES